MNHLLAPLTLIASGVILSMLAFIYDWTFYIKFTFLSCPYIFGQSFWPLLQAYQGDILPRDIAALGFAVVNSINSFGGFFGPTVIGSLRKRTGSFILPLAAASLLAGTSWIIFSLLHVVPIAVRMRMRKQGQLKRRRSSLSDVPEIEISSGGH